MAASQDHPRAKDKRGKDRTYVMILLRYMLDCWINQSCILEQFKERVQFFPYVKSIYHMIFEDGSLLL